MRKLFAISLGLALVIMVAFTAVGSAITRTSPVNTKKAKTPFVHIDVTGTAVPASAAIQVAITDGYFARQHIDATFTPVANPALVVPALISGQAQFGVTGIVTMMSAQEANIPVKIVAPTALIPSTYTAVVVPTNSPITTAAQLNGKTFGVIGLQTPSELQDILWVNKNGGNASTVNYVLAPLATGLSELASGEIAAWGASQPYLDEGLKAGTIRVIGQDEKVWGKPFPFTTWDTSSSYLAQNPGVVKRFDTAMAQAGAWSNAHPKAVRAVLPTFTGQPASIASTESLVIYGGVLNLSLLNELAVDAKNIGWLTSLPNLKTLIYSGAPIVKK